VLLQRSPRSLDYKLPAALDRIRQIPGVLGISHKHFWELRQDEYIGSIVLQLDYNVDDQGVKAGVRGILRALKVNSVTIGIEKDVVAVY
jgi:Co/Zn/Cd efflux system component